MNTDPTLPVESGTELAVSCISGYTNTGADSITCAGGDSYLHSGEEPQCLEGKYRILEPGGALKTTRFGNIKIFSSCTDDLFILLQIKYFLI